MSSDRKFLKRFLTTGVGFLLCCALAAGQSKPITARAIVTRIQERLGVPWQTDTVDTFKAGNPDEPITGIAVTMMATMDVLERAAASGKNESFPQA